MPSTIRSAQAQKSNTTTSKVKFRTVLGFGSIPRASYDLSAQIPPALGQNQSFTRKSIDTARSYTARKQPRADRINITNASFFQSTTTPQSSTTIVDLTSDNMKGEIAHSQPTSRRLVVRMDAQDGLWSVSVAETPHDPSSYSLYIKTPTHNLTLTRSAMEVIELDQKLREAYPNATIPPVPIDVTSLPAPPKRKSIFNTLSRLASPSGKTARNTSYSRRANNATIASALATPASEINDPFTSAEAEPPKPPSANSTLVAAYLTTISNTTSFRQARVWKRFFRVRTDDLESVRVERAIKRVRSDLAAHIGSTKEKENAIPGSASIKSSTDATSITDTKLNGYDAQTLGSETDIVEVTMAENGRDDSEDAPPHSAHSLEADVDTLDGHSRPRPEPAHDESSATAQTPTTAVQKLKDESSATTQQTEHPSRIRSQSADPDKSSRLPRAFVSSALTPDGTPSQTGDESSVSTTGGSRRASGRKKRSMSTDPNKELKKKSQRKVVIDDFEMMRVLGKGCAGKVLLVKHKSTQDLYALKAITKRHVLAHQELQHTLTEQAVLKRMAAESKDPFVVKLWWSFHDKENLFLVMDFHPGGDLATQLARWGRLGRDRARFYAAEIVEGVEGLHAAGVIYRDLKPENILIGGDGHIVLTDFGLSKEFPRRTTAATSPSTPHGVRGGEFYSSVPGTPQPATPPWMKMEKDGVLASGWPGQPVGHSDSTSTFCGTAEYLAPEVIQGLPYSYEVDWWSFGTMLYEMLTGITPFWAANHSDMYVRVLQDELQFPDDRAIDQDTKSLIRGLLQRNPGLRICEPRIKRHPYFSMIDWSHVYYKRYIPPYIPPIDPSNASDTQNFDDTFLDMEPVLDDFNDNEQTDTDQEPQTDADRTDGEESNTTPSQSRSSSIRPQQTPPVDDSVDVFDGYSFKGRHSVLIEDDDDASEESNEEASEEGSEILQGLDAESPTGTTTTTTTTTTTPSEPDMDGDAEEEELGEPRTPEARPIVLESEQVLAENVPVPPSPPQVVEELPPPRVTPEVRPVVGVPETQAVEVSSEEVGKVPTKTQVVAPPSMKAAPPSKSVGSRLLRPRREKSGVPALDRYLSDGFDEDVVATEREDDEDDDWDIVEAADGEDRNGAKGTSLFARGVVDRYRLAVFKKNSTPSRTVSGMSKASENTIAESGDSPSPSRRRGRTPGLTFRKQTRQFLRPRSPPPSSYSSKSSGTAKSLSQSNSNLNSNSNTLSASSASITGLLTPSPSMGGTLAVTPSLKSKESAISVGTPSVSSDQSGNGDGATADTNGQDTIKGVIALPEEPEKHKSKKLKKYKENAEKVFSLFSSPRQPS